MLKIIDSSLGRFYHPVLHRFRAFKESKKNQSELKRRISQNQILAEASGRKPRIYVDVTDVFLSDKGTGIQRVAKEISRNLKEISANYDVVDVYCKGAAYSDCGTKREISLQRGDIFFILDQSIQNICNNFLLFQHLMQNGVRVVSFFHDLIPVTHPQFCHPDYAKDFRRFLKEVLFLSQIICNSESTANELKDYLAKNPQVKRNSALKISHSLLGCDFSAKGGQVSPLCIGENKGKPHSPAFLMVSTVEPRKMYAQAVGAFTMLWEKGVEAQLWIVGRPGWRNEKTISLIENHTENGIRLFWYKNGISDEELASLYKKCDAVLFASIAEGFGLAVAEGAHFKKPLILRDIPVFREIAGENAFYFTGEDSQSLAAKIEEWLSLYQKGYPCRYLLQQQGFLSHHHIL